MRPRHERRDGNWLTEGWFDAWLYAFPPDEPPAVTPAVGVHCCPVCRQGALGPTELAKHVRKHRR